MHHVRRASITDVSRVHRRGAAIYMTIVSVSLMVAVLSLAALNLVRVERRTAELSSDMIQARLAALAAAEMAVRDIQNDDSWRTRYTHDVETSSVAIGDARASWKLCDVSDTSLSDNFADGVVIKGIGRHGESVWVESVTLEAVVEEIGPQEFQSYTGALLIGAGQVNSANWYAQYFHPALPDDARAWRVSKVQLNCEQASSDASVTVTVGLQLPASNKSPSGTSVDAVTLSATSLPSAYEWMPVSFSSNSGLDPEVGLCLTLSSTTGLVMRFKYDTLSIASGDTAMTQGSSLGWGTPTALQTFLYKVQGYYTTCRMRVVTGSWQRTAL